MKSPEQTEGEEFEFGPEVDLHHFHPRDTGIVVHEFLKQGKEKGLSRLRIVHGKGRSQKKSQVHSLLTDAPEVESFSDDGSNWGATIVNLRQGNSSEEKK